MTFHADLTADAVLPADLRSLLTLTDADSVYVARRPREPMQKDEVWIERLETDDELNSSLRQVTGYSYFFHVRARDNAGSSRAGDARVTLADTRARAIVEAYNKSRRLLPSLPSLVSISAREDVSDADPDDRSVHQATVRVTFFVRE